MDDAVLLYIHSEKLLTLVENLSIAFHHKANKDGLDQVNLSTQHNLLPFLPIFHLFFVFFSSLFIIAKAISGPALFCPDRVNSLSEGREKWNEGQITDVILNCSFGFVLLFLCLTSIYFLFHVCFLFISFHPF